MREPEDTVQFKLDRFLKDVEMFERRSTRRKVEIEKKRAKEYKNDMFKDDEKQKDVQHLLPVKKGLFENAVMSKPVYQPLKGISKQNNKDRLESNLLGLANTRSETKNEVTKNPAQNIDSSLLEIVINTSSKSPEIFLNANVDNDPSVVKQENSNQIKIDVINDLGENQSNPKLKLNSKEIGVNTSHDFICSHVAVNKRAVRNLEYYFEPIDKEKNNKNIKNHHISNYFNKNTEHINFNIDNQLKMANENKSPNVFEKKGFKYYQSHKNINVKNDLNEPSILNNDSSFMNENDDKSNSNFMENFNNNDISNIFFSSPVHFSPSNTSENNKFLQPLQNLISTSPTIRRFQSNKNRKLTSPSLTADSVYSPELFLNDNEFSNIIPVTDNTDFHSASPIPWHPSSPLNYNFYTNPVIKPTPIHPDISKNSISKNKSSINSTSKIMKYFSKRNSDYKKYRRDSKLYSWKMCDTSRKPPLLMKNSKHLNNVTFANYGKVQLKFSPHKF